MKKPSTPEGKMALKLYRQAVAQYEKEGEIEFDHVFSEEEAKAQLSESDLNFLKENGGTYVRAWVWVSADDVE